MKIKYKEFIKLSILFNLPQISCSAGYKCHLGGYPHMCCENNGEGPNCWYDGRNGCNPNYLNTPKECDETYNTNLWNC